MNSKILNSIALLLFLTCCFMLTLLAQEKFPSRDSKEWKNLSRIIKK